MIYVQVWNGLLDLGMAKVKFWPSLACSQSAHGREEATVSTPGLFAQNISSSWAAHSPAYDREEHAHGCEPFPYCSKEAPMRSLASSLSSSSFGLPYALDVRPIVLELHGDYM